MKKFSNIALIAAAGSSLRLNEDTPKPYIKLSDNRMIIEHSLEVFNKNPKIDAIFIIFNPKHQIFYDKLHLNKYIKLQKPIIGGTTRQESILLALKFVSQFKPENILIHDAARPFIDNKLIDNLLEKLNIYDNIIPAIKIKDSIKLAENNKFTQDIKRDNLYKALTPQAFKFNLIYKLHDKYKKLNFTDDAAILQNANIAINFIEHSELNFKITDKADLMLANLITGTITEHRIGTGFDVHAFNQEEHENNFIKLGGISIPYPRSLIGHSDADIVIHALTDAILGALNKGDIGEIFPDKDPQYKNADSTIFLQYCKNLLSENNAYINNIDVIIIAEEPTISPFKKPMAANIANILNISPEKVNIKATTTEKLGYLGRKEGIAAQALISLQLKK